VTNNFFVKKKHRNMWHYCLLMSVLEFILSDAHFCLSYGKFNYCKILIVIVEKVL